MYRFGGLIFLFPPAYATFIVLNSKTDVKSYLLDVADGLPESERPSCCTHCKTNRRPHRHGQFKRWLSTLTQRILLPVFRFLCPACKRTMSVLPEFAEVYHEASVQVKHEVIQHAEAGMPVTILAIETRHFAGGPYAEKTLRRWLRAWRQRLLRHQERLWELLLHEGLETELPRERISDIRALLAGWNKVPSPYW